MRIITASVRSKQAPASYYDRFKTNHIADHARPKGKAKVNLPDLCTKQLYQTFGLRLKFLPLMSGQSDDFQKH